MPAPIRTTLGIDEAGRGPSIGPMVMAAVALDSRAAAALTRAGLTDSKTYGAGDDAHETRVGLAKLVRERAKFVMTVEIEHHEIDSRVMKGELNVLEREHATVLIEKAHRAVQLHRIIADGKRMFTALGQRFDNFESHDKAEAKHAAVAAASVVAKVLRDERFHAIRKRYEKDFGAIAGGGYANAHTRKFLRAYAEKHGRLPEETRLSWPHPYVEDLLGDVQLRTQQSLF